MEVAVDGDRWGRIVAGSLVDGMRHEIATAGWAASRVVAAAGDETTVAAWLEPGEDEAEGLVEVLLLAAALGSDRIAHAGLAGSGGDVVPPRVGPRGRRPGAGRALGVEVVDGSGGALQRRAWSHPLDEAGGRPRLGRGGEVPAGRGRIAAALAGAVGLVGCLDDAPATAALLARCCARGHDLLVTGPLAARLLVEAASGR